MLTTMSWSDRQEVEIGNDDRVQTLKFVQRMQAVGCSGPQTITMAYVEL